MPINPEARPDNSILARKKLRCLFLPPLLVKLTMVDAMKPSVKIFFNAGLFLKRLSSSDLGFKLEYSMFGKRREPEFLFHWDSYPHDPLKVNKLNKVLLSVAAAVNEKTVLAFSFSFFGMILLMPTARGK